MHEAANELVAIDPNVMAADTMWFSEILLVSVYAHATKATECPG